MPTLRLYGAATLTLDSGAEIALAAREAALLAWLHLEGPTPRARLAALLWPGGDESRGRTNLRQTLARLRRAAGEVLAEDDGVLALAAAVHVLPAEGDALLAGLQFDDADDLAAWLAMRRDDGRRAQQRAALAAAQQCLAGGDLDGALAQADALLAQEPESEQAWRIRMEALYLAGDRAAAIAAWDECREVLRRAFGVAPSQATNELGKRIIDSAAGGAPGRAALPAALRRPPQLVGRDGVRADIERCLQLRHAVVIAGPGGIGKSRLLGEVVAAHAPSLRVAARPGDRVLPGASFARLLHAALQRFDPPLDEATRSALAVLLPADGAAPAALKSSLEHRHVLLSAARALRACAQAGLRVLAIDDLQHADDASIGAMQVLIGEWIASEDEGRPLPDGRGLLPVFGVRDAELSDAGRALLVLLAGSRRSARFDLAPLALDDVSALLAALPLPAAAGDSAPDRRALAQALLAQVGGAPAYLLESLKTLWLDGLDRWQPGQALPVPSSLREALRARLERLPMESLQLAQLAAIAGRDFSLTLAAASLGRTPLALAPVLASLQAAQVFEGDGFAHDLVAEAVRDSVPAALVPALHQLVADHLQSRGGEAASVAWHLQQAGAVAAAVPWHLQAARTARDRWQLADAARSFETAAVGLESHVRELRDSGTTAALAWLDAARWWTAVSDYRAAQRALERGLAAATTANERLQLRSSHVVVLLNSQRADEAVAEALALAHDLQAQPDLLDPPQLAAALFACAAVIRLVPAPQRLAELCEALRAHCMNGPPRARQSYHLSHGLCLSWLGRPTEAERELAQARRLADEIGDHGLVVNVTNQQIRTAMMRGDFVRAAAALDACQSAVQAGGYGTSFRAHVLAARALLCVATGRPAEAINSLQALRELRGGAARDSEHDVAAAEAICWWHLGHADRAASAASDALGAADNGWIALVRTWLAPPASAQFEAALLDLARCWPVDDSVMGMRRRALVASPRVASPQLASRHLAPEQAPALEAADAMLAQFDARGLLPLSRLAHTTAARAALQVAAHARAVAHARAALALASAVDPWVETPAGVWLDAAQVLRAAGEDAAADAALRDGRAWVEQASATLADADHLQAWCEGNPVHRALLQRTG